MTLSLPTLPCACVCVCVRAEEEDVELAANAMALLVRIAKEASLRYAIQLITTASLAAQRRGVEEVGVEDIKRVYSLFLDVRRSCDYLEQHEAEYMFHDSTQASKDSVALQLGRGGMAVDVDAPAPEAEDDDDGDVAMSDSDEE
ncbi:RuvB-like protein [Kipferlia bialata]|uniref:RuvB-like helicase n=1 Tax=Kipferlia bialata TaxID=797122 RepID=A0A391NP77_9EUKA|nr:RuvB-like protein [Kipferlia bialata]|eukprot:g1583.t1